ncbi:hypothetical protein N7499_001508 [Penicillium canescens]|uniref:DUF4048 domain-containing protein n=1 Tax=Penicillium canescens TaxID=5083 RepID=A0AAD6N5P0_PENCN|nr:uncharacterized protein N7446_009047 [Penicillium canescens]KAJ6034299.1 hypothetical protein N7460_008474 [Penicillium canescens]KAJ6045962.1 hypothetical protein N7444_007216 [Penicillium canescens]KAJ6053035.1 hypothetical protein N7446_009047 [Penicillium canescens]KAJ6097134.1 hypothetical protein N7499_001508 [Penicillium canescens]KAJ6165123.1 hypothetical protein N7485_008367 [Penicillium canescens]
MESIPGAESLTHGPPPDANQTPVESASESRSLKQNKRLSLPSAKPTARHAKRLTLNFPVNLNEPESTADVSSPGAATPITQPTRPPTAQPGTPMSFDVPDDGYDFLRAIASQERKVMELREELHRAEADLVAIKKQWALSEKNRKRAEINHAEPLMPLRSPDFSAPEASNTHHREQSMSSVGSAVSQERISRDLERRTSVRAAATNGTKIGTNGRRVFQGAHTRTLSLLSPVTASGGFPREPGLSEADRVGRTPRSATLPSVERNNAASVGAQLDESQVPEHLLAQWRKTLPPPSREALMRTGKQMASDLREGLWTFLEDIRQATVGEEGINGTQTRNMSPNSLAPPNGRKRDSLAKSRSRERLLADGKLSRSSSSSSRGRGPAVETKTGKDTKPAEISTSFWDEFGIDTPAQKSPNALRAPSDQITAPNEATDAEQPDRRSSTPVDAQNDELDNWDSWDTPSSGKKLHTPSSSRSTVESKQDQSPVTQGSSPRTSASFGDWNPASTAPDPSVTEGIPWPTITKLAPSKLQRTASNLMAEWERSLSPSPERASSPSLTRKDSKKD